MRSRTTTVFRLKARCLMTSDTEALRVSASALRTTPGIGELEFRCPDHRDPTAAKELINR